MKASNDWQAHLITNDQLLEVSSLWQNNIRNPACVAPPLTYHLGAYTVGDGTVTPGSDDYDVGTTVTLTAVPGTGAVFDHWSGDVTGTNPTVDILMDRDKEVTAHFKPTAAPPPYQVYTVGVYYLYLEGSNPRNGWLSWASYIVNAEASLFADYCGGSLPISWVYPYAVRQLEPGESRLSYTGKIAAELKLLPNWAGVDFKILVGEYDVGVITGVVAVSAVAVSGLDLENTIKARAGDPEYVIADHLPHELGHLFIGVEHCNIKPCPMVPGQNWESYQQWLDFGQKLWFCDSHRQKLLENWGARSHG